MNPKRTIKDVAAYAGVGVGTVSRVLNQNKNVKPSIRQKVEEAIKILDYQPNHTARSLRTNISKTVVFFVPDISNVAFSTIAKGLHDVLEEFEYNLILDNIGDRNVKEKLYGFFSTRKVDGVILALNEEDDPAINKFLNELQIPLIVLDRELHGVHADYINTDYYHGIKTAVDFLVTLGHRNIGFATGSPHIRPCRESLKGYTDALKLNDIPFNQKFIQLGSLTQDFGKTSMKYFIEKWKAGKITALIAGSYPILVGILETIQLEKIRIPDDLSLIAFEDSDLARLMNPSITTIRRPLYDIGKKVAYALLDRLSSAGMGRHEPSTIIVPTELVIRASAVEV